MDRDNCSSVNEFIFLGITEKTENKVTLFTLFLLVYLINLLANLGMITLIRMDPQLHTPMYFFLSHLSFCDLQRGVLPARGWSLPGGKWHHLADALIHTALAFHLHFCGSNGLPTSVTYLHSTFFPALIHRSMDWQYLLFLELLNWAQFQEFLSLIVISSLQSQRSILLRGGSELSPPAPPTQLLWQFSRELCFLCTLGQVHSTL